MKKRITCLTVVLNLTADEDVQNHNLCHLICHFLKEFYQSLEIWGYNDETMEVGWLLGNLISKSLSAC